MCVLIRFLEARLIFAQQVHIPFESICLKFGGAADTGYPVSDSGQQQPLSASVDKLTVSLLGQKELSHSY